MLLVEPLTSLIAVLIDVPILDPVIELVEVVTADVFATLELVTSLLIAPMPPANAPIEDAPPTPAAPATLATVPIVLVKSATLKLVLASGLASVFAPSASSLA